MSPIQNARVYLAGVPTGWYPKPGTDIIHDLSSTIDLESVQLNGGLLVKTLILGIDPWMRGAMIEAQIGQNLVNFGVSRVLRSEHPAYQVGDYVEGLIPFQEYNVLPSTTKDRIIKNEQQLPLSLYVGVTGMPGKTAYYGWKEYSSAKKGEVVFVTTAAGAVGSLVIQLAKLDGTKVIASSGSDDKVAFAKELGADVSFNYKTTETSDVLAKEGPINIYWDHVGGETLDNALRAAAPHARFIEVGMISLDNGLNGTSHLKSLGQIVLKHISLFGFSFVHLDEKHSKEFETVVPKLVKDGKLKFKEETFNGLHLAGEVILAQLRGENTGKPVIIVADN